MHVPRGRHSGQAVAGQPPASRRRASKAAAAPPTLHVSPPPPFEVPPPQPSAKLLTSARLMQANPSSRLWYLLGYLPGRSARHSRKTRHEREMGARARAVWEKTWRLWPLAN